MPRASPTQSTGANGPDPCHPCHCTRLQLMVTCRGHWLCPLLCFLRLIHREANGRKWVPTAVPLCHMLHAGAIWSLHLGLFLGGGSQETWSLVATPTQVTHSRVINYMTMKLVATLCLLHYPVLWSWMSMCKGPPLGAESTVEGSGVSSWVPPSR